MVRRRASEFIITRLSLSAKSILNSKNLNNSLSQFLRRACTVTARQYGEVVLPDASTGQGPGTLAAKLSRCKEGMARVFAVQVQILLRSGAIAVQV